MAYYTRVLSKDEEFPAFDELAAFIQSGHPDYKLTIEEGTEEEWESLLLSGNDEVEVALLERIPAFDEPRPSSRAAPGTRRALCRPARTRAARTEAMALLCPDLAHAT